MANKRTVNLQIITILHVSAPSCHPQGARIRYLAKLHKYFMKHVAVCDNSNFAFVCHSTK